MSIISTQDISKIYNPESIPVTAIDGITLSFEKAEFTAIVGPSGCGKTTLLNLIGGLEIPTTGTVRVNDEVISTKKRKELTEFRLHNIGFVFQAYNLIPVLSAYENIAFIMELLNQPADFVRERTWELLKAMEIEDKAHQRPNQLSGGQQQRVAVARALAPRPKFILADEPTANLDSHATGTLLDMMLRMTEKAGTTFIFSTHDDRVMRRAKRLITLIDGKVESDEFK